MQSSFLLLFYTSKGIHIILTDRQKNVLTKAQLDHELILRTKDSILAGAIFFFNNEFIINLFERI
jgi:hypothetical protein